MAHTVQPPEASTSMPTTPTDQRATARPAYKAPACFRGDAQLPVGHADAKTEAIGNALVAADEKTPVLRLLSQAWLDAASAHPAETRQLADDIEQNLKVAAQQPQPDTEQLVDVAVQAAVQAVTASLAGLQTNPTDVAKRLHRSIDNAQGWHLAEVGGHDEVVAYSNSRLGCAIDAMADTLKASRDKVLTVRALRSALELVISEAGL